MISYQLLQFKYNKNNLIYYIKIMKKNNMNNNNNIKKIFQNILIKLYEIKKWD